MFAHNENGAPIQVHRDGCNITVTFANRLPMAVRREARNVVAEHGRTTRVKLTRGVVTCTLVRKGLKGMQVGKMYEYVEGQLRQDLNTYWVYAQRVESGMAAHPAGWVSRNEMGQ